MPDKDKRKEGVGLKIVKAGGEGGTQTVNTEAQNFIEEFKAQPLQVVDCSEQVIVIGVTGGYVTTMVMLDPDRHRVMGALSDAYELAAYGEDQLE